MKSFEQLKENDKIYNVIFDYNTYKSTLLDLIITDINIITKDKHIYRNDPYDWEEYDVDVQIMQIKLNNNSELKLNIDPNISTSAYGKFTREPGQGVSTFYSTNIEEAKEYIRKQLNNQLEQEIKERDKHNNNILTINKEYSKWIN